MRHSPSLAPEAPRYAISTTCTFSNGDLGACYDAVSFVFFIYRNAHVKIHALRLLLLIGAGAAPGIGARGVGKFHFDAANVQARLSSCSMLVPCFRAPTRLRRTGRNVSTGTPGQEHLQRQPDQGRQCH